MKNGTECFQIHICERTRGGRRSRGPHFSGACSFTQERDDRKDAGTVFSASFFRSMFVHFSLSSVYLCDPILGKQRKADMAVFPRPFICILSCFFQFSHPSPIFFRFSIIFYHSIQKAASLQDSNLLETLLTEPDR